jgi:transposase InsO family protein
VLGISKQAVSQHCRRQLALQAAIPKLIAEADALRKKHPGCGVQKMYYQIKPSFLGRDKFIEIMMDNGFRLRRPHHAKRTTIAGKVCYRNLIKGLKVFDPYHVWQSDITYVAVGAIFCYVVFIVDVYTKVIVGYAVSMSLKTKMNLQALNRALRHYPAPRVHHSDRGIQYSSLEYVNVLKSRNVAISMGLPAQDNAYAERLNRTIKEEYLDYWKPQTYGQLKYQMRKAVFNYNFIRGHEQLKKIPPKTFESRCLNDPNFVKPMVTIFENKS